MVQYSVLMLFTTYVKCKSFIRKQSDAAMGVWSTLWILIAGKLVTQPCILSKLKDKIGTHRFQICILLMRNTTPHNDNEMAWCAKKRIGWCYFLTFAHIYLKHWPPGDYYSENCLRHLGRLYWYRLIDIMTWIDNHTHWYDCNIITHSSLNLSYSLSVKCAPSKKVCLASQLLPRKASWLSENRKSITMINQY